MTQSPSPRVAATMKRDMLMTLLASIEEVKEARVSAQAEGQSEAGEYLSLQALGEAEDALMALMLEPAVADMLGQIADALGELAGEAA
jgi:hypothetical protein